MQEWLDALRRLGKNPIQKDGGRYYVARCPAHDDNRASLSITQSNDGKVLVKCFVGCTFESVRSALGFNRKRPVPRRQAQAVSSKHTGASPTAENRPPAQGSTAQKKAQVLPSGPNIQRWDYHDANGKTVLVVTRSDPGKRFFQWTPAPNGKFYAGGFKGKKPLYRLLQLLETSGKVAVVEGEKCAEAVVEAWPSQLVVTWAGGAKNWHLTDWSPLRGREVSLLADADDAGHDGMKGLAKHLHNLGCNVKIALPNDGDGSDVFDWLQRDGVRSTGQRIARELGVYTPPEQQNEGKTPVHSKKKVSDGTNGDDEDSISFEQLESNEHYRILGVEGTHIVVRLKAVGQVLRKSREQAIQPGTLIALAPEVWWCKLSGASELSKKVALRIGDSIIRLADRLGQVDVSAFVGPGAYLMRDGNSGYHLGDRLIQNGEIVALEECEVPTIAGPPIPLDDAATGDELEAFVDAFMSYRWATPDDGRRLMGWLVAAILGGALEWRPHVYFVAPPGSGKSWMLQRLVQFLGPLALHVSNATAASLARLTGHSALPLIVDEANAQNEWVMQLIELMRIASGSDGARIRSVGSENGVTTQRARFCALLTTHAPRTLDAPDASRIIPVRLGDPVEDWLAVKDSIDAVMPLSERVRSRFIRNAGDIVAKSREIARDLEVDGTDSRRAMLSGAITAGWQAWGRDNRIVFARDGQSDIIDYAVVVLQEIMSIRHREDGKDGDMISLLLDKPSRAAQLYGMRLDEEDNLLVANQHSGLNNGLRHAGLWGIDLGDTLLQIEGASRTVHAVRFGSFRQRAVCIPREVMLEAGFEISRTGVNDAIST